MFPNKTDGVYDCVWISSHVDRGVFPAAAVCAATLRKTRLNLSIFRGGVQILFQKSLDLSIPSDVAPFFWFWLQHVFDFPIDSNYTSISYIRLYII